MQHPVYLKAINERLGIDNVGISAGPHAADGAVWWETDHPGDPGGGAPSCRYQTSRQMNIARYLVLESLGWVKIKPDSDPGHFFAA